MDFQRWLSRVPTNAKIQAPIEIIRRIKLATEKEPYCYKDPRFCYTLPVWKPYLSNSVFICVFRDPASTAMSILKECNEMPYLKGLRIDFDRAIEVWTLMYKHVLEIHSHDGKWLFIHYNQVLTQEGLNRLESITGAQIDRSFPDPTLKRSISSASIPYNTRQEYLQLCMLSGYTEI